jgi:hypothetical protein
VINNLINKQTGQTDSLPSDDDLNETEEVMMEDTLPPGLLSKMLPQIADQVTSE